MNSTCGWGAAFAIALVASSGGGCATVQKAFSEEGVVYESTAEANFAAGEKALADKGWDDAIKFFTHVKNKYPYSKYAVLAGLRVGDAHFGNEKDLEAIEDFRGFIKLHPKHDQVPYATFMVAKAFYARMPEEWFFLPPVSEKDQTPMLDAQSALLDYLARYPDDAHAKEARELLDKARSRLIAAERYAADYYARNGKWRATAWRSRLIAERFPDAKEAPHALLRAGEAYEKLGEGKAAIRQYQLIEQRYAGSDAAKEAQARMKKGVAAPAVDEVSPAQQASSQAATPAAASAAETAPATDPEGDAAGEDDSEAATETP